MALVQRAEEVEQDLRRIEAALAEEGLFTSRDATWRRAETLRILVALAGFPAGDVDVARARRALERARGDIR